MQEKKKGKKRKEKESCWLFVTFSVSHKLFNWWHYIPHIPKLFAKYTTKIKTFYPQNKSNKRNKSSKPITLKAGEPSSSDATTSWVATSGFHCKTEHRLLSESEKLPVGRSRSDYQKHHSISWTESTMYRNAKNSPQEKA